MLAGPWAELYAELARWRDLGRQVDFWWRDDDAGGRSAALDRLVGLAAARNVPLALAAIPAEAYRGALCALPSQITLIQHGVDHRNRAREGEKKSEFPPTEPVDVLLAHAVAGRAMLEKSAPGRVIAVLAPPWNRISPELAGRLESAGYCGLSTYGVKKVTVSSPRFVQINTHVDIVDWRGTRGFCGVQSALSQAVRHLEARRRGEAPDEPTGWLTHHAVHDSECWDFLDALFEKTCSHAGVAWCSPATLFSCEPA